MCFGRPPIIYAKASHFFPVIDPDSSKAYKKWLQAQNWWEGHLRGFTKRELVDAEVIKVRRKEIRRDFDMVRFI